MPSACVDSKLLWNDTTLRLTSGMQYRYSAVGTWIDKEYECDADGYDSPNLLMRLAEPWRRVRAARWFRLIGSIDRNPRIVIVMGTKGEFVAPATGQLTCFANDWMSKYGNNSGTIDLEITAL